MGSRRFKFLADNVGNVTNRYALAFAVCLVFVESIALFIRHVPQKDVPRFIDRTVWMLFALVLVAIVAANRPDFLRPSQRFEITGKITDEKGNLLDPKDFSVELGANTADCGELGKKAVVRDKEFKFGCTKDPGELLVGVTMKKGSQTQTGIVTAHQSNVLVFESTQP